MQRHMTKKLSAVRLAVRDPKTLATFYTRYLGMQAQQDGDTVRLGYGGDGAALILCAGGGDYRHSRTDQYWKISITLPNVDIAYQQLAAAGLPVSAPHQFGDIAYMCHLNDPEGFVIELLQHDFIQNRPENIGHPDKPLGGGALIGLITLRCPEIEPELAKCLAQGMTLLSIQPVLERGFVLYFLAFTSDTPPNGDLEAIENREWLWKRPYTSLELQHCPGAEMTENSTYLGLEVT